MTIKEPENAYIKHVGKEESKSIPNPKYEYLQPGTKTKTRKFPIFFIVFSILLFFVGCNAVVLINSDPKSAFNLSEYYDKKYEIPVAVEDLMRHITVSHDPDEHGYTFKGDILDPARVVMLLDSDNIGIYFSLHSDEYTYTNQHKQINYEFDRKLRFIRAYDEHYKTVDGVDGKEALQEVLDFLSPLLEKKYKATDYLK